VAMKVADETGSYVYARSLVEDMRSWSLKKLGDPPKIKRREAGTLSLAFLERQAFGWDFEECGGRLLVNAPPRVKSCYVDNESSEVTLAHEGLKVTPPQASFIDYFLLDEELAIFVKSPTGKTIGRAVPIKSEQLARLVDEFLSDLSVGKTLRVGNVGDDTFSERGHASSEQNKTTSRPERAISHELYDLLINPVREWLPTHPQETIVIVPDRLMWRIPFSSLVDENGKYFGDQHVLTYAPSESMWIKGATLKRIANHRSVRAWVVGDPRMPPQIEACGRKFNVSSLPGAQVEAEEISRLINEVGKAELFLGSQADRLRFEAWHSEFSVLHLATHAGAWSNDALNSFIIMSEVTPSNVSLQGSHLSLNDDPRFPVYIGSLSPKFSLRHKFSIPGLLKMWEVLSRFRTNADLITLSACQTAKGTETGQGVIGFSRAFLAAGARSLLVSLRSVADEPTHEFMVAFYREYLLHGNKGLALQRAMQRTRESYPNTKYWAAFTLHGLAE
jgi:CHAT domain-containing protein